MDVTRTRSGQGRGARRLAATLAVAIGLTACAGPSAGSEAASPAVADGEIELLDAGVAPRAVRTITAEPGDVQLASMAFGASVAMTFEGRTEEVDYPPIRSDVTVTVVDVDADGSLTVELAYSDVDVTTDDPADQELADDLAAAVEPLDGVTETLVLAPWGEVLSHESPDLDDVTGGAPGAAGDPMSAPFPAEPIGVGAHWRITTEDEQDGMPVRTVTDYRLTGAAEDELTGTMTITMTFVPGEQYVDGVTLEVLSGELTGTSEVRWVRGEVMPYAEGVTSGGLAIEASAEGETARLESSMSFDVAFRPRS
ncbi:MAG: hypothetical protein S0880_18630 [Actinomycetota bacterium]|nr:hypothetical protein [Actinomycetota bacterium]